MDPVKANPSMNEIKVKKKRARSEAKKDMYSAYLYIAPFFIIFAIIGLYPMMFSIYLAFQKWNGLSPMVSVGLDNFKIVLTDPLFWKAVYNTIVMGIMGTAPQIVFGIIFAYLLNLAFLRFKNFFRVTIFMPYITSMVAVACPRPIPFVSRVIQIDPPPIPTLIKSAPHSARKRKPSLSTTLPAPTLTVSP